MSDEPLKESEARCSGVPVTWLWQHRPAALRSFEELRRFAVNVSVALFVGVVLFVVVQATFEDTIVIDPILVPKVLEDHGYSGTAISRKLMDWVRRIDAESATSKTKKDFGTDSRFAEASSIRLPSSSVSVQTVVTLLRNSFGAQGNRITGEITIDPSAEAKNATTFVLTLHLVKSGNRSSKARPPGTLDEILELSARDIVEEFDAAVLGDYLLQKNLADPMYDKNKVAEVDELLDRLLGKADRETMPWLLNLRGLRLHEQGKDVEAQSFFERAVRLDPRFAPAYVNMARALGDGLLPGGRDYDGAIELYSKATRYKPMYAAPYYNWGTVLRDKDKKDYDRIIEKFRKAIEVDPKMVIAYRSWGVVLSDKADDSRKKQDYDEAMAKFRRAIEIDPIYASAYDSWGDTLSARAFALGSKADYDEAMAKYQKAIDLNAKDTTAYNNWGFTFQRRAEALGSKADYDEAIAKYQKATDIDPKLAIAYRNWGNVLDKQDKHTEALEKFNRANELDRN
jgi:tetratricopeptide (TPR) repeat protein